MKSQATWHAKTQTLETGLPYRHWKDYLKIQDETGCIVFVIFIHEKEKVVLCNTVNTLKTLHNHTYEGNRMDRGGTIFFKFDQICKQMTLDHLNKYLPAQSSTGVA